MMKTRKTRASFLLILAVICLAVSGCSGTPPPNEESLATITGTVRGSLANTLIYHAKITADGGGKTYTAYTNLDGVYTLNLPAGSYDLTVAMNSFNDAATSVTASAGETTTRDFALVTGSGDTIFFPDDENWYRAVVARTMPDRVETRSLDIILEADQYRTSSVQPSIALEPPAFQARSIEEGYKCYIYSYCGIYTANQISAYRGMRVYRSFSYSGPFTLIAAVPFEHAGSIYFTNYYDGVPSYEPDVDSQYYLITLWSDDGETPPTTPRRGTFLPALHLLEPANGQTDVSLTPTLSWSGVGTDIEYCVNLYKKDGQWVSADQIWIGQDSYTVSPLEPGTEYLWCVEAFGPSGDNSISYARTFTTATE